MCEGGRGRIQCPPLVIYYCSNINNSELNSCWRVRKWRRLQLWRQPFPHRDLEEKDVEKTVTTCVARMLDLTCQKRQTEIPGRNVYCL